jgi:short-subunit dehydrogenase
MTKRTWVLFGATSLITEQFAHIAAHHQHPLRLVGRDLERLSIIAKDIQLRFPVRCELFVCDLSQKADRLLEAFADLEGECDLFIAHSDCSDNASLTTQSIDHLVKVNLLSTAQIVNHYLNTPQKEYNLLYLSSVAAGRGRAKNSLYGGTKRAVELYLEGLQQQAKDNQHLTVARLGFIDTKQTYGLPGLFYAAAPKACAKACWNALKRRKKFIYYPSFWRIIIFIFNCVPFFIYKKIGKL